MTEEGLLSAIRAAPRDDTLRQVYADWLEQAGRPGCARVVRAEVAVRADPGDPLRWEALHRARAGAPAAWLLRFEQPSLLRTPPLPLEASWWASDLGHYRPSKGTYQRYPYASLPDIDADEASSLDWLGDPALDAEETHPISDLAQQVHELGYALPAEMLALFRHHLPVRNVIVSFVGCRFDIDPETWRPVPLLGGLMVPFYDDLQSTVSWGLWLHRSGAQAVVSFKRFFEVEGGEEAPADLVAFEEGHSAGRFEFVSPSLASFVYRFALENQIWYAILGIGRPARVYTPVQRRYLDHYEP